MTSSFTGEYSYENLSEEIIFSLLSKVFFQLSPENDKFLDSSYKYITMISEKRTYDISEEPIIAFTDNNSKEIIYGFDFNNLIDIGFYEPKDFTHFSFSKYSSNYSDPTNKSIADLIENRCYWTYYSISYSKLFRIGWFNADSTISDLAKADKRFSELYVFCHKDDSTISEAIKLNMNRIWLHNYFKRNEVFCNKYNLNKYGKIAPFAIIRYSELLLTKAYIEYKQNKDDLGLGELNLVRKKAGLPELSSISENDIHIERERELLCEGDRLDYYKALKKDILPGDRDNRTKLPFDSKKLYFYNVSYE
jgi:hypothetical protein